jgi:fructokinase
MLGGAPFNFAFHCHQLGHAAAIVSRVGEDELGRELRERVRELGLSDEQIQTDHELPTGTVRVTVDQNGQPRYTIKEGTAWSNLEWTSALATSTTEAVALCHGSLALEAGTRSRAVIARMALQIREQGGLTIYDVNLREKIAERPDDRALLWSQWLKVNTVERDSCRKAATLSEDRVLIVTHGADGAEVIGSDFHFYEQTAPAKVVDTVGAGDAFTAALACLHLEGRPMPECLRFANYYAALVCEHQGATPRIDRKEVEEGTLRQLG